MAAPPFTVTVSGILRSSLSVYNNDIGVFWFNVVVLLIEICLIFNFFCRKSVFEEHFNCLERIFVMEQNSISVSEIRLFRDVLFL